MSVARNLPLCYGLPAEMCGSRIGPPADPVPQEFVGSADIRGSISLSGRRMRIIRGSNKVMIIFFNLFTLVCTANIILSQRFTHSNILTVNLDAYTIPNFL